jgi:hypothetical protein
MIAEGQQGVSQCALRSNWNLNRVTAADTVRNPRWQRPEPDVESAAGGLRSRGRLCSLSGSGGGVPSTAVRGAGTWLEDTDAEADDVIAALAGTCPARDMLIASVDEDYYQLVRDAGPG